MFKQWRQNFGYIKSRYRNVLSGGRAPDIVNENSGILCLQPFYFIEITTSGDVYTCCPGWIKFPLGSIKNKTIAEIWNTGRARFIRRKIYSGEWQNVCNSICPRISEYTHEGRLIPYDYLDTFGFLTPHLVNEIQMNKEYLDSSPTVFNFSNSTVCNLSCIMCTDISSMMTHR